MEEKICPFCKTSEGIESIVYSSDEHNYPDFKGKDVVCLHCAVCSEDIKISEFEGGVEHGRSKKKTPQSVSSIDKQTAVFCFLRI